MYPNPVSFRIRMMVSRTSSSSFGRPARRSGNFFAGGGVSSSILRTHRRNVEYDTIVMTSLIFPPSFFPCLTSVLLSRLSSVIRLGNLLRRISFSAFKNRICRPVFGQSDYLCRCQINRHRLPSGRPLRETFTIPVNHSQICEKHRLLLTLRP